MKRSTASPFWGSEVVILPDMRRRGAQKGYLYEESDQWKLRWWVDTVDTQGNAKRVRSRPWTIGRSKGPGKITKRRAQTIAAEKMAEVNRGGTTTRVTVYDFIVERFTPDHVAGLTGNGRRHYRTVLERHVEPTFGSWELPEIKAQHVIQWLQAKAEAGYSRSHLTHMRNVLHAIYEHAHRCGIYEGRNPAAKIKIPRSAREPEPTQPYTLEELRTILDHLPSPLWEMFVLGASTSMHAARAVRTLHRARQPVGPTEGHPGQDRTARIAVRLRGADRRRTNGPARPSYAAVSCQSRRFSTSGCAR